MRIVIYGANGMVGSRIAATAVKRGHEVVAVSRSGADVPGASSVAQDFTDADATLARLADADADAAVVSVPTTLDDAQIARMLAAHRALIDATPGARLVVIGGVGSLWVGDRMYKDTDAYDPAWLPEANANTAIFDLYRASSGVDFTLVSPSPEIAPGERTGYVTGLDSPVGERVSAEDFADAIVDELERPAHRGRRFTVASR